VGSRTSLLRRSLIERCLEGNRAQLVCGHEEEIIMFIALAFILSLAWMLGLGVFHVTSAAIHGLVVLAIVSVALHFVRRQRRTV